MICVKVSNIRNDEKRLIKRLMGMGISENEEKNIVNDVYA
jgi:Fe2+ transport system protein FeoA